MLLPQVYANTDELFYLAGLEDALERAESSADLQAIRQELVEEGLLKSTGKKGKTPAEEPLPPFAYALPQGFTALAGRNHKQNDQLTLKIAAKEDLWLHAKNMPGSHVIVRNPQKQEIPGEVIEKAAAIAAYHSKPVFSNQVPVDYTPVKQVKKTIRRQAGHGDLYAKQKPFS